MKRLTVMDLDSMIYLIAYNNRDELFSGIIKQNVEQYIDDVLTATKAEAYAGFYQKSGHKNYRKDFYPGYKSKRPPKPDFIEKWGKVIMDKFEEYPGITGLEVIESDDALSIFSIKYADKYDITYARIDKDLKCIPGNHYNYKSGTFSEVGAQEAAHFAACQVLTGDSGDTIPGVPGVGPVKADTFIKAFPTVIQAYKAASKSKKVTTWIRNFYRDYHSVRLLHDIGELKQFTDREEVDFFIIDEMEYDESDVEDAFGEDDW